MKSQHARRKWLVCTTLSGAALVGSGVRAAVPLTLPYQLTHSQNMDARPSPDGQQLIYISVTSGREQLFIMKPDGSSPRQLTHDDTDHEDPAWSPDGKLLAFVRITANEERIYVMSADGTHA